MAKQDVKKLLQEVQESLLRSQRMLEALEERQSRRSTPPPAGEAPPETPPLYQRRQTASYDTAYLTGGSEPRGTSGEYSMEWSPLPTLSDPPPSPPETLSHTSTLPPPDLSPPPTTLASRITPKARPPVNPVPPLARVPAPPPPAPSDHGRYSIIQERNPRKHRPRGSREQG